VKLLKHKDKRKIYKGKGLMKKIKGWVKVFDKDMKSVNINARHRADKEERQEDARSLHFIMQTIPRLTHEKIIELKAQAILDYKEPWVRLIK